MIELGGGFEYHDLDSLSAVMSRLCSSQKSLSDASSICEKYIAGNIGATEKIYSLIFSEIIPKMIKPEYMPPNRLSRVKLSVF